ncbi:MAG: hypothetical protein AMXMBFR33_72470 [Candidatus Xenobia bacterium]
MTDSDGPGITNDILQAKGASLSAAVRATIEIGKLFSVDPAAVVKCPVCHEATLVVEDFFSRLDPNVLERKISCPSCGRASFMRLTNPGPNIGQPSMISEALDFAAKAVELFEDSGETTDL